MPPKKYQEAEQPSLMVKKRVSQGRHPTDQVLKHEKPRKLLKSQTKANECSTMIEDGQVLNFYENIEEVPTYDLTKQDMQGDPIKLLGMLQEKYKQFGAVKLTASDTWNCPFTFRYVDKQVTTRIQCLQKLKEGKAFEQKVGAYRVESYERKAHQFSSQYKFKTNPEGKTLNGKRQQEYWNLVTKSECTQQQITLQKYLDEKKPVLVEYAADLSTSSYGSGFPVKKNFTRIDKDFEYQNNFFNLNNISKAPSSLLSICEKKKEKISGISFPWLYMGMMFSTFCWHVEDSFVNSLNYNHKGAVKTWYIVPGHHKKKFDDYVERKFAGNQKKKSLLEKIILMVDPKELVGEGIKVYKVNQNPRDYVCTFFKAYHGGFSHGFNVGEAVNFVSIKSLKYIEQAEKHYLYTEKNKQFKPKAWVLCKEWIIHQNINQNKLKNLTEHDQTYYEKMLLRQFSFLKDQLIIKGKGEGLKLKDITVFPEETKYEKLSCDHCKNYVYLSAINCENCGILCENHIERCSCVLRQKGGFQLYIREPNQKRKSFFLKFSEVVIKVIENFQDKGQKQKSKNKNKSKQQISRQSKKCSKTEQKTINSKNEEGIGRKVASLDKKENKAPKIITKKGSK